MWLSLFRRKVNGLIMIKAPKGVRALFSEVNKVGKRIKASKKKLTWKFSVDSREHTIDMYVSSLSSKRKVLLDGDLVYSGKAQNGVYFHYPMKVDRVMVAIEQMEDAWDLKIGGVSFAQLAVMRQSAPDAKDADWGAAQEWKADKESEFGPVHNKWDDWEKPKAKPKAAEEWEDRADPRAKASWDEEEREEPRNRRKPEDWEEREVRPKPAARPAEDYDWDTKGFPQDEEEYAPRRDPRDTRPQRREPPRDEYLRRDDERYRRDEEQYRAKPREEDRRRREEDRYREERLPPRRPSPERETDYEFRSRPADPPRKPPREEYERPKQPEFDPFEIHDNPPPARKTYYEEENEEENLYPSLSSLDAKRQAQQASFPAYQPPPPAADPYSAPANPYSAQAADPYSAPAADRYSAHAVDPFSSAPADPFSNPAANVFESQPAQTSADFTVTSSRPFEDPFGAPPPKKADADISHLVDLDGLNLGDDYSPAVLRKREEQNRVVSIGLGAPNVPMNQLKPNQPGPPNPMMTAPMMPNPMMQNPMAAAMMMQSYMTGMMMNSMMMNQGGAPQQRYF